MPLTHTSTFRVRYYECDAHERVIHSHYLRYMQEAAFDASAAGGYDLARYTSIGCHWLIRGNDVTYLRPLRYGDSVQVTTWVADFRRVTSRRMYELRLAGSGELAARAYTDWAFLDSASGRPAAIPPELVAAFFPDGLPQDVPPRDRFRGPPPPPPGVFRQRRRVAWADIDPARHVNNATYLDYVQDCQARASSAHGWPMARLEAEGWALAVRRHQIEYRQPARLDDELELATWLCDVDGAAGALSGHTTLTHATDGELVARARTLWEWLDAATEQPAPIPAAFLRDLAPNTAA
jgi:acyl-CoA thioester hydrolase